MSKSIWQLAESLAEAIPVQDDQKDMERAMDAVTAVDRDLVGNGPKAKRFIMALIDQAGFSVPQQKGFAKLLGLEHESFLNGVAGKVLGTKPPEGN